MYAPAVAKQCFANQRTIEGASQTFQANTGALPASVSELTPEYIKSEPECPTTRNRYVLGANGIVEPCSEHGHY